MKTDPAYRGMGAILVAVAVAWVAERAGMSNWETVGIVALVVARLQMVAGNGFW